MLAIALSEPALSEAHDITIFEHGDQVSVSVHLKLPATSPLQQTHDVAHDDRQTLQEVKTIVRQQTGTPASDIRLLPTEAGIVLFITIHVGAAASLARAHQAASELEEGLRQQMPLIADVVVHTEP